MTCYACRRRITRPIFMGERALGPVCAKRAGYVRPERTTDKPARLGRVRIPALVVAESQLDLFVEAKA